MKKSSSNRLPEVFRRFPGLLLLAGLCLWACQRGSRVPAKSDRPKISFTFDDGVTNDMPGYPFEKWNAMLLGHLKRENVQAAFFVTGRNKLDEKGRFLLNSWDDDGHLIANHSYTHPSYGSKTVTCEMFREEFLKTDEVIKTCKNYRKLFRFPYLKEGDTPEKIACFRQLLAENGYRNGHVTIDASDWAINNRLVRKLQTDVHTDLTNYRKFYLQHLAERADFYEKTAFALTGRHIHHTILLHHNLTSALFAGDLIRMFREKGWEVVSASTAFDDPIFQEQPANVPAGESLVWALAKQSGRFESLLRYPAEDEVYEREKMDALKL